MLQRLKKWCIWQKIKISVPDFNKRFQVLKEIAEAAYRSGDADYGDVEDILKQADKECAEMITKGTWLGTNPSGEQHESTFTANCRTRYVLYTWCNMGLC